MKTQGTSKFVTELITDWLKQIRDPAQLDSFEKLIADRRKSLAVETDAERNAKLVGHLKDCKYGDVLYLMKPLPKPTRHLNTKAVFTKYSEDMNRLKCKFYAWQPRKKLLWVTVPWKTDARKDEVNFKCLHVSDIHRLQPSRTEAETRLKLQHRARNNAPTNAKFV